VLALEDVQWLDRSSLDVLGALARRHHPSRLWMLCTCRPLEVFPDAGSLQRVVDDLEMTRACVVVRMKPLKRSDVDQYAASRFEPALAPALARLLNRTCGGHPLLLTAAADAIVERRRRVSANTSGRLHTKMADLGVVASSVVGRILVRQLDHLTPEERSVVNAVSVLGPEFSVWQAAHVTRSDAMSVEQILDRIARRGEIIDRAGDAGDERAHYGFTHRWYPEMLSARTALGNAS
jgi:predicted ATPase